MVSSLRVTKVSELSTIAAATMILFFLKDLEPKLQSLEQLCNFQELERGEQRCLSGVLLQVPKPPKDELHLRGGMGLAPLT